MKKTLSALLILCMALTVLCSCGGDDGADTSAGEVTEAVTGEFANDNDANFHSSWKRE